MTEQLQERIAELEKEVANLKNVAYGFGSFHFLSNVEEKRARAFCEKHRNHGQPPRPLANRMSSITFCYTSTGVGPVIVLKCRECKAEEDVTDPDCW